MDELDKILKNKFSPLKDMDLPNEDQEWKKLQKKVKWQNFKTFRLASMNVYYAAFSLVALCGIYVFLNFHSDEKKEYKKEIKFIKNEAKLIESEKEVTAKMTQKVVRHTDVKSENKKAKLEPSKEERVSIPVSEKMVNDSVQLPQIPEKEIVQQTVEINLEGLEEDEHKEPVSVEKQEIEQTKTPKKATSIKFKIKPSRKTKTTDFNY